MASLLLFAAAREATQCRQIDLDGENVTHILRSAIDRFGDELKRILPYCTVMVDGERASLETHVTPDSEVAIIPPVSGGAGEVSAAILTVSDRASSGIYKDMTGPAIEHALTQAGMRTITRAVVPDDTDAISTALTEWCDAGGVDLVLTNGGTGLGPRDITPEATAAVIERDMPGLSETIRLTGRAQTPLAVLSRGVSGTRGRTLIINLPGSPTGAVQGLAAVADVLPHAVAMINGGDHDLH